MTDEKKEDDLKIPPQEGVGKTVIFMLLLSVTCAVILSTLASLLEHPKEVAKDLDRSKQMMIAAHILNHQGYFILPDGKKAEDHQASNSELLEMYRKRLKPFLLAPDGKLQTFEEAHLKESEYLTQYKKTGYYKQPYKLIYKIVSRDKPDEIEGYVIPINGFGLWDAIYGYLAIRPDGNTVIGTSWYDQKETPGLGANITEESWQAFFPGKKIFQGDSTGKVDIKTAPLGIVVVKGKVAEVLGTSPKSMSAVDGMAGATLTGNGVTDAYKLVLAAYRPFLEKLYTEGDSKKDGKS